MVDNNTHPDRQQNMRAVEREIETLIAQHGFDIEALASFRMRGLTPGMLLGAINQGLDPSGFRRAVAEGFDVGAFAAAVDKGLEVWLFARALGTDVHMLNAALCRVLQKHAGAKHVLPELPELLAVMHCILFSIPQVVEVDGLLRIDLQPSRFPE
jgi:hypothetical protein